MAKVKEIACIHYEFEGKCKISNKKCRFYKEMQYCDSYVTSPGGRPARKDLRKEKNEKFEKDKRNYEY